MPKFSRKPKTNSIPSWARYASYVKDVAGEHTYALIGYGSTPADSDKMANLEIAHLHLDMTCKTVVTAQKSQWETF